MITGIDMIGTPLESGTRTYNLNFCEYINKLNFKQKIYVFISKDYIKNISNKDNPNIEYIVKSKFLSNIIIRVLWMQLILPFELKKLNINQLYSPMNLAPIFLKLFNIKLILTLHSNLPWVFFNKMPGNLIRNFFTRILMEISISVCDKLIVNSNFAKNEIMKLLKIQENKIHVVYLGIGKNYLAKNANEHYLKNLDYKNYVLSVLSCVKYHNIINLLKAFKLLDKKHSINLKFIFVLQILDKEYFKEIVKFIDNNFEKGKIIFFHNLENSYLVNLYKNAHFYIFSSYSEVFGLTSLEAMSQKCPVIISKSSALPEINGKAAIYFDPDNELDIKNAMEKVLTNVDYRNELINKGNIHLKNYNWENTVKETLKILEI